MISGLFCYLPFAICFTCTYNCTFTS